MSTRAVEAPDSARAGGRRFIRLGAVGWVGVVFLSVMLAVCVGTLPWTLGRGESGEARYNAGETSRGRLPPMWVTLSDEQAQRTDGHAARTWLGTDTLGRSLGVRVLTGGGISLMIGLAAAALSVCIGTMYGAIAGYAGGRVDGVMMRIVDVLYGLPYVLLVVLLAVASDAVVGEYVSRQKERAEVVRERAVAAMIAEDSAALTGRAETLQYLAAHEEQRAAWEREAMELVPPRVMSEGARTGLDLLTLLVAIGGVSWLTMARVIRGQVLSLREQPFIEAARAMGLSTRRIFLRHLLPNLVGPIVVYATLTVPQAILQESFLSFLGIGVNPPLPSWGSLAAEGLPELNQYQSNWWLLLFPCLMLGLTLLSLNFVGEGLREALDPKRRQGRGSAA